MAKGATSAKVNYSTFPFSHALHAETGSYLTFINMYLSDLENSPGATAVLQQLAKTYSAFGNWSRSILKNQTVMNLVPISLLQCPLILVAMLHLHLFVLGPALSYILNNPFPWRSLCQKRWYSWLVVMIRIDLSVLWGTELYNIPNWDSPIVVRWHRCCTVSSVFVFSDMLSNGFVLSFFSAVSHGKCWVEVAALGCLPVSCPLPGCPVPSPFLCRSYPDVQPCSPSLVLPRLPLPPPCAPLTVTRGWGWGESQKQAKANSGCGTMWDY